MQTHSPSCGDTVVAAAPGQRFSKIEKRCTVCRRVCLSQSISGRRAAETEWMLSLGLQPDSQCGPSGVCLTTGVSYWNYNIVTKTTQNYYRLLKRVPRSQPAVHISNIRGEDPSHTQTTVTVTHSQVK